MHSKTVSNKNIYSFDIDGVLADTAPLAVKLFNKRFNDNKKVSDLKGFFIVFDWIKKIIADENKALDETVNIWNDKAVLSKSKPVKGAIDVINDLLKSENEIHLITSRPNFTKEITINWINKWFPKIRQGFIHMSSETGGHQRLFKAETIGKLKPHVHFEDSIEHIGDILKLSPGTKIVLIRQPWNMGLLSNLGESVLIPTSRKRADIKASYSYFLVSSQE